MRAIALGALLGLGCFPPALPREDVSDSDLSSNDDTADVGTDTTGPCTASSQCAYLDGPCAKGGCGPEGRCEAVPLSGTTCDDGAACTRDDVCVEGVCRGETYTCSDGLECTTDVCDGRGSCVFPVKEGHCAIDGECIVAGTPHPTIACQACGSGRSWSAVDTGACEDGDVCTVGDTCRAGVCVGGGTPDDAPDDFFKTLAVAAQPAHSLSIIDLIGLRSGGLVAQLRLRGSVTLSNGWTYANPDDTDLVVYVGSDGAVTAAYALEGARDVIALGEDLAAASAWSATCNPCSLRELPSGDAVPFETSPERPFVVVRVKPGTAVTSIAVSHAPEAMDALDQTYTVIERAAEPPPVVVLGPDGATLALYTFAARAVVDIVAYSSRGVPSEIGQVRYEPPEPVFWPEFVRAGRLVTSAEGHVALPMVSAPATITARNSFTPLTLASTTLVLATHRNQETLLQQVIRDLDSPLGFGLMGDAHVVISGGTVMISGYFAGQEVVFGSGAGAVSYQSSQFWGMPGSGTVGAGLEGYLVKFVGNDVAWLRTLRPLGHPMPWEIAGSNLRTVNRAGTSWLVSGILSGFGAWTGGASQRPVMAPAVGGSSHGVLASFGDDGRLVWSASTDGSPVVTARAGSHVYLGGLMTSGTNGVGPTRINDPNLEVPTPRVYLQRFDSAGGLSCGVGP